MKEGYKETKVGIIPKEWEVKKLEDICQVRGGKRLPKGYKLIDEKNNYPYIRVANMYNGGIKKDDIKYVPTEIVDKIKRYKISKDDLFISVAGTLGIVGLIPKDLDGANLTENADKLCNIKINKIFLMKILQSDMIQKIIDKERTENAQPKLALTRIKGFLIPVPSLNEQEKIADILSTVDSQIDDTDKLIEKTKELKKGLMQRLLTKGIGHKEFKKTEVGEIPVEWEVERLGDIVTIKSGNSPSKFEFYDGGKYPFFKVDDMNYSSKYLRTSKLYYNTSKFDLMKRGMIIFPKRGAAIFTNKILILDSDGFFDTNLMGLICNKEVNNQYLYYFLFNYKLSKIADTSSIPQINNKHIEPLLIYLPKLEEQEKIAEILSSVDNQIEEYENKKSKLEELKKGLMQQLLTGKIRVKI